MIKLMMKQHFSFSWEPIVTLKFDVDNQSQILDNVSGAKRLLTKLSIYAVAVLVLIQFIIQILIS